jgi:hypothetical protein
MAVAKGHSPANGTLLREERMISAARNRRALFLVLGALALAPRMGAGEESLTAFLKYVYTPFAKETARLEGAKKFVEGSRESIVFTNESNEIWKFGLLLDGPSDVTKKQSGSLQIRQLKGEDATLETIATLVGDDQPVVINPRFNTIVVTPIHATTEGKAKEDFFRVCYLQDSTGRRVLFSLNKSSARHEMPRLGFVDQNKSLAQSILRLSPNGDNLFLIAKERF